MRLCPSRTGRLLGRWKDRAKEYIYEKGEGGLIKQGGSVWIERGGGFSAMTTPLGTFLEAVKRQSYRQVR